MSNILVTDLGLSAITNAEAGGFLVDLATFSVTQALNFNLSTTDTALIANPVYSGQIEYLEAVGPSTVRATLLIPDMYPTTGTWTLTEIGIFCRTGQLFAHGKFKVAQEKTSDYAIKILVYITCARLVENLNLTIGRTASLPSVPHVRSLIPPNRSEVSTLAVLDQSANQDEELDFIINDTASLAVKSGPGGIFWSFVGYDRKYYGKVTVINNSALLLDPEFNGFWLNDGEQVLIQHVAGPSAGESRKALFNKASKAFSILEKPFTSLNQSYSIFAIWRKHSNTLPKRVPNTPEYYVLGVGKNTYDATTTASVVDLYVPQRITTTSNGSNPTPLPQLPDNIHLDTHHLYINGNYITTDQYLLDTVNNRIVWNTVTVHSSDVIDIYVFIKDTNQTGYVLLAEAIYDTDGVQTQFNLPVIPDIDNLFVFFNGVQLDRTDYTLGSSFITTSVPAGKLAIVTFGVVNDPSINGTTYTDTFTTVHTTYTLSGLVDSKFNTLVFSGGKYIDKSLYDCVGNQLTFKSTPVVPVEISVFNATPAPPLVSTASGKNTGPIWQDPAGILKQPNLIIPVRYSFAFGTGTHASVSLSVSHVPDPNHVMVFINGLLQQDFVYDTASAVVTLTATAGFFDKTKVEVICFTEVEDTGQQLACITETFTTITGKQTYDLLGMSDFSLVFAGGLYQHAADAVVVGDSVSFVNIPAGITIEIWHFITQPILNGCTDIELYEEAISSSPTNYMIYDRINSDIKMDQVVNSELLSFVGPVFQQTSTYAIELTDVAGFLTLSDVETYFGNNLVTYTFASGRPKTRLVLQDEYDKLESSTVKFDTLAKVALLPRCTTAERDSKPAIGGMITYNKDTDAVEVYANGSWQQLTV